MEALRRCLHRLLSFYASLATAVWQCLFSPFHKFRRVPICIPIVDAILSLYFAFACNLVECTVDLDDHTSVHVWAPAHRRFNKPNLVMIHGYGGNSKWQFVFQVGELAKHFNLYIPDLLFFGKSYTNCTNRTEKFQSECVGKGLKRLGVDRCSIYAISYGGFVGCRMAEMYPEMVEKLVIVSTGVGCTEGQKAEQLKKVGVNPLDLLLPDKPDGLRLLVEMSIFKSNPTKWSPDFFLQEFIDVMCNSNRKEKQELVEHLLAGEVEYNVHNLDKEMLIVWGDKDKIFPLSFAHHLLINMGMKSRLEVIPDTGHAVNMDSPYALNALIKEFILPFSETAKIQHNQLDKGSSAR